MLGVLDRWTPTVNLLQTLIAQISFHIEMCPIEAIGQLAYIPHPRAFGLLVSEIFFILFCLKKQMSQASDQFGSQVRGWVNL